MSGECNVAEHDPLGLLGEILTNCGYKYKNGDRLFSAAQIATLRKEAQGLVDENAELERRFKDAVLTNADLADSIPDEEDHVSCAPCDDFDRENDRLAVRTLAFGLCNALQALREAQSE